MFATKEEESFFISHITKNDKVLEYGSGESTSQISNRVKELISIEHQKEWFEKIKLDKTENSQIYLVEPNLPYSEGNHCGTYEEFRDYIEFPIKYGPYDVILIDGRARVHCASIRKEYEPINDYLELVEQVGTMGKYKINK